MRLSSSPARCSCFLKIAPDVPKPCKASTFSLGMLADVPAM